MATIGQIVGEDGVFVDGDWVESKDQDPSGKVRLIQLADVGNGEFTDKSARFLTNERARELKCTFLHRGDILIARMPDPLGRACIFPLNGDGRFVTVVDVCIVRPGHNLVDPKYLMYAINSPEVRIQIDKHKSGSTRKRISRGNLARIGLPFAPYREQRRIVAKIEELFFELGKGIGSLRAARVRLESYRETLLACAFTGCLTEVWRRDNTPPLAKSTELRASIAAHLARQTAQSNEPANASRLTRRSGRPRAPGTLARIADEEIQALPPLPEGWLWIKVQDLLTEPLANGRSVKDRAGGFPVLRLTALNAGRVDLSEKKDGDWDRDAASPYLLREGDFLVARGNGSKRLVGRGGLVPLVRDEVAYPDTMIRLRTDRLLVYPDFLALVWESRLLRQQVERDARTTAGIYKINQHHISNSLVPVCTLAEQRQVLQVLDSYLSVCDRTRDDIDAQLGKADLLRQAILDRAFAGELVEQNPRDEPASVLMERIVNENGRAATHSGARRTARRRRTGT